MNNKYFDSESITKGFSSILVACERMSTKFTMKTSKGKDKTRKNNSSHSHVRISEIQSKIMKNL